MKNVTGPGNPHRGTLDLTGTQPIDCHLLPPPTEIDEPLFAQESRQVTPSSKAAFNVFWQVFRRLGTRFILKAHKSINHHVLIYRRESNLVIIHTEIALSMANHVDCERGNVTARFRKGHPMSGITRNWIAGARLRKVTWLLLWLTLSCSWPLSAQLLETNGDMTTNDVAPRSFKFQAQSGRIFSDISVHTRPGTVGFEIRSPDGHVLNRQSAGVATISGPGITVTNPGSYELVVTPHGTAGHWNVQINQLPPPSILDAQVLAGGLMILVALSAVFACWLRTHVQWRWFWAGAGIWMVGVALKTAVALPLNPILFNTSPPLAGLKLCVGSIYCGLMTGVFEIGVTLAAALVWPRLAATPGRALAVGLGSGAFEALLLGLGAAVSVWIAKSTGHTDALLNSFTSVAHTPLLWLASPVERIVAILAHTAARVLVFRAVAARRWRDFWAGFGWLGGLDLVAGIGLLTGMVKLGLIWSLELMLLPFGLLSLPLVFWAVRHWPAELRAEPAS